MKSKFLKIAGVKSEKEFYKKYPSEEAFFKAHPEAKKMIKKAQWGTEETGGCGPNQYWDGVRCVDLFNMSGQPVQNVPDPTFEYEEQPKFRRNANLSGGTPKTGTGTGVNPSTKQVGSSALDKLGGAQGIMNTVGNIASGISEIQGEKQNLRKAKQFAKLSGVITQAAGTRDQQPRRKYVRPEDVVIQPEEIFPTYGVGTNYLAKNGGEIQNTYAPNTLYKDLGYEPIPKAQWGEMASGLGSLMGGGGFNQTGGGKIGSTIGGVAGSFIPGVGTVVGSAVGGLIGGIFGGETARKTKKYNKQGMANMQTAAGLSGLQDLQQGQFSSFMKDGGWVSNDWQPQVITKFGEYSLKDLLASDKTMDTLKTGGHLRNNISDMELGGSLSTHWGGYAEPMSENPYLPGGGETVMFRGQSHDETDGKGNSGIGITYGDNPVEVERNEPAVEMKDGTGKDSLVIYGNLKINKMAADEIGDPKAKGKKFKSYVADISKKEAKQNKLIDNTLQRIDNEDDSTPFGQLALTTGRTILKGADMKLKDIAEKKMNAAAVQNAINDTAEEFNLSADHLATGKFKKAKKGAYISKAQSGKDLPALDNSTYDYLNSLYEKAEKQGKGEDVLKFQQEYHRLAKPFAERVIAREPVTRFGKSKGYSSADVRSNEDAIFGERTMQYKAALDNAKRVNIDITPSVVESYEQSEKDKTISTAPLKKLGWQDVVNQLVPYLRPSDVEDLDPNQLLGEQYALATNQLEPVQAQTYRPLLEQPFDISLQDQLNEITANQRGVERLVGRNPEALASIAGQSNRAKSQVLAEQFRQNQAEKAGVYGRNRNTLNDAFLRNMATYDQQYVRQSQAESNTKAVARAALDSISSEIAQNKLENRTLATYENMYNYRFDPKFRAVNYNPMANFTVPQVSGKSLTPIYDKDGKLVAYQAPENVEELPIPPLATQPIKAKDSKKEKSSRNGSIVKAIKGL